MTPGLSLWVDCSNLRHKGQVAVTFCAFLVTRGDNLVASNRVQMPPDHQGHRIKQRSHAGELYSAFLALQYAHQHFPGEPLSLYSDYDGLHYLLADKQVALPPFAKDLLALWFPHCTLPPRVRQQGPCLWYHYAHRLATEGTTPPERFSPLIGEQPATNRPEPYQFWHHGVQYGFSSGEEISNYFGQPISQHDLDFLATFTKRRQLLIAHKEHDQILFRKPTLVPAPL